MSHNVMDNSIGLSSLSESARTQVLERARESEILDVSITGILYNFYTD